MRLTDSRGKKSTTLFMVVVGLGIVAYIGIKQAATLDPQSFGIAWMSILVPWVGREWKEKDSA